MCEARAVVGIYELSQVKVGVGIYVLCQAVVKLQ